MDQIEREKVMEFNSGCLICGAALVYQDQSTQMKCEICGKTLDSNAKCKKGHFICDACHGKSAFELIKNVCLASQLKDPLRLAISLMKMENIKMHGPEHHALVPCTLVCAYANTLNLEKDEKERMLEEAAKRGSVIPGGFCGFDGACGAGIGTGIFISIIKKVTPLARQAWGHANEMTATSLMEISKYGGPRCCKRDTYLSIIEACDFTEKKYGTTLEIDRNINCEFSSTNKTCLKGKCIFYEK